MDATKQEFYSKLLAKLQKIQSGELSVDDYLAEVEEKTKEPIKQKDTISNHDLEMAAIFFKKRTVRVDENPSLIKAMRNVLQSDEVITIVQMIQAGKFHEWYNSCKKHGHPDFSD
jgi:hypothetical protein